MFSQLLIAWCLMAICVAIHAVGVSSALVWLGRQTRLSQGFWPRMWLFICLSGWMVLFHLVQIFVWAVLYACQGALPDLPSAAYFSAVTYTTTGYGDVVLPEGWRLVGAVEALTGILMCGLSTGFFFAMVSRSYSSNMNSNGK